MGDFAYDQGYDAWNRGLHSSDNPYDPDEQGDNHLSWDEGWNDAAEELGEEG